MKFTITLMAVAVLSFSSAPSVWANTGDKDSGEGPGVVLLMLADGNSGEGPGIALPMLNSDNDGEGPGIA